MGWIGLDRIGSDGIKFDWIGFDQILIELLLLLFMTKFFSLWGLLFSHSKANFNASLVACRTDGTVIKLGGTS